MQPAIVRQQIEKIEGVSRTWFEWAWEDSEWVKTLVVEVALDTDPNVADVRMMLDAIWDTMQSAEAKSTMIVTHLKVVPALQGSADSLLRHG
jgi:hypothetical protein